MLNNYHHKPKPIIILSKDEEKQWGAVRSREIQRLIAGVRGETVKLGLNVAPMAIGMELEVEDVKGIDKRRSAAEKSDDFDKDAAELLMYFKTDSSLVNGFEIVSHPRTLKSWFEIKNRMKDFMKRFRDAGFRSYDTGRCGMHFHINRTAFMNQLHIAKFIHFWEQNHELSFALSRRSISSMVTYSHFQSHRAEVYAALLADGDPYGEGRGRGALRATGDLPRVTLPHHSAVALTPHTVEIRIFRGTMNVNTILTTMEMVAKVLTVTAYTGLSQLSVANILKYIPDNKKNKKVRKLLSMSRAVSRDAVSNKDDRLGGSSSYLGRRESIFTYMSGKGGPAKSKDSKKILEEWIGKANEYEIKILMKNNIKVPDLIGKTADQVIAIVPEGMMVLEPGDRKPTKMSMINAIYDSNIRRCGKPWAMAVKQWHLSLLKKDEEPQLNTRAIADWGNVIATMQDQPRAVQARPVAVRLPRRPTGQVLTNLVVENGTRTITMNDFVWDPIRTTTGGN